MASPKSRVASSSSMSLADHENEIRADQNTNTNSKDAKESPSPFIRPLNGASVNNIDVKQRQPSNIHVNIDAIPRSIAAVAKPPAKKIIFTPGGFADTLLSATYVAETNLPTDIGHYRIRAYRIESQNDGDTSGETHPLGAGAGLGSEPCVIYCTDKPPFGERGAAGRGAKGVPVRIHDQCFTSEVFRSKR